MLSYLDAKLFMAKAKLRDFAESERGEVNIVTIVVLVGIAVALALLFKGRIETLLDTLFDSIDTKASNAIK